MELYPEMVLSFDSKYQESGIRAQTILLVKMIFSKELGTEGEQRSLRGVVSRASCTGALLCDARNLAHGS